jgi:hypothetical protein
MGDPDGCRPARANYQSAVGTRRLAVDDPSATRAIVPDFFQLIHCLICHSTSALTRRTKMSPNWPQVRSSSRYEGVRYTQMTHMRRFFRRHADWSADLDVEERGRIAGRLRAAYRVNPPSDLTNQIHQAVTSARFKESTTTVSPRKGLPRSRVLLGGAALATVTAVAFASYGLGSVRAPHGAIDGLPLHSPELTLTASAALVQHRTIQVQYGFEHSGGTPAQGYHLVRPALHLGNMALHVESCTTSALSASPAGRYRFVCATVPKLSREHAALNLTAEGVMQAGASLQEAPTNITINAYADLRPMKQLRSEHSFGPAPKPIYGNSDCLAKCRPLPVRVSLKPVLYVTSAGRKWRGHVVVVRKPAMADMANSESPVLRQAKPRSALVVVRQFGKGSTSVESAVVHGKRVNHIFSAVQHLAHWRPLPCPLTLAPKRDYTVTFFGKDHQLLLSASVPMWCAGKVEIEGDHTALGISPRLSSLLVHTISIHAIHTGGANPSGEIKP